MLKVVTQGRIALGMNDDAFPVSYLDGRGEHVGYQVEVCERVVQALRQRLDLPNLKIIPISVNRATRLSLLNNGTIDIACSFNPVTRAGLQQALFAHADLLSPTKVMARSELASTPLAQLGGKTISTLVGDVSLARLRAHARQAQMQVKENYGRTATDAFSLLETGRADVVMLPEAQLLALRERSQNPDRFVMLEGTLGEDPVALMFRHNDEKLVTLANEVIDAMMRTGEMARLYNKWFVEAGPDQQRALNLPLSPRLQAMFAEPGSEMQEF